MTPADPSVAKGLTQQFTATGTYSDNSTEPLTTLVTWASATTSVATISTGGLATAVAATGTSLITAKYDGITGSTTLNASPAVLESIAVTPASPMVPKGETQQFTATGTYSDNSTGNLTGTVTWASATTSVATISTGGLATAVAATGTSLITAKYDGITGSTTLNASPAVLESIAVTPASPMVPKGETQQFTATGTYSDNSTGNLTGTVTWASATTSVATISTGGLATAVAATGTSLITAKYDGITGSTTLNARAAVLESIAVTPASPTVPKGETQQFTATGMYSDNSTGNLTSTVTWASATTSVATISNTAGSQGLATGVGIGTSNISASLGNVTSPADTLTVTGATIAVSGVSVDWGSQTAPLYTAGGGLLLPAGRTTDLPWFNINRIAIVLAQAATLTPADVSVTGITGGNYGPVSISGSGTSSILITFDKAIAGPDLVTITISSSQIITFTGQLDVLPGDVNDDGVVNTTDGVLILRHETPANTYNMFDDMNGDGAVTMADFTLYRPQIGTVLPALPPQLAAGGEGPGAASALTPQELDPVLTAAIDDWAAAGLPEQDVAKLRGVTVQITNLPAGYLGGTAIGGSIMDLSANAAGYGWSIGTSSGDPVAPGDFLAGPSMVAAGHEDLLTVVMHELGHTLGLSDLDPTTSPTDLMAETLATGVRRLPSAADVAKVISAQTVPPSEATTILPPTGALVDALFEAASDEAIGVLPTPTIARAIQVGSGVA